MLYALDDTLYLAKVGVSIEDVCISLGNAYPVSILDESVHASNTKESL